MNKTQDYIGKHVKDMTDEERIRHTVDLPLLSISEFGLLKRRMWMRWVGAQYNRPRTVVHKKLKERKKQLAEELLLRQSKYKHVL